MTMTRDRCLDGVNEAPADDGCDPEQGDRVFGQYLTPIPPPSSILSSSEKASLPSIDLSQDLIERAAWRS